MHAVKQSGVFEEVPAPKEKQYDASARYTQESTNGAEHIKAL